MQILFRTSASGDTTIAETVSQLAYYQFNILRSNQGVEIVSVKIIDLNGNLMKQFKPANHINRNIYI
jgi:hypothetical protein